MGVGLPIEQISLTGVTVYEKQTTLKLPRSGVVLITGPNGAGKSTWVEAVSVGLWDTPLGTKKPMWSSEKGLIELHLAPSLAGTPTTILRAINGTKKRLRFSSLYGQEVEHETNTKTQEALTGLVGTQEQWALTHLFASHDTKLFSRCADTARKEILEQVFGLNQLDGASAFADAKRREAKAAVERAERVALVARTKRTAAKDELDRVREQLSGFDESASPAHPPAARYTAEELAQLQQALLNARADEAAASKAVGKADAWVEAAEHAAAGAKAGECPKCGQKLPVTAPANWKADLAEAQQALDTAEKREGQAKQVTVKARKRLEEAQQAQRELVAHEQAAVAHERRRARLRAADTEAYERLLQAVDADEQAQTAIEDAQQELALATAAAHVLSPRGYRAAQLKDAIQTLERCAKHHLRAITRDANMTIALTPTAEKADGELTTAIGLEVYGAGGNHGYTRTSAGQRRKIDIALFLALSQCASGSGTLFFDEVFDGLDAASVPAVCEYLRDIAATRCVVVISHNELVAEALRPVAHYRVAQGTLKRS